MATEAGRHGTAKFDFLHEKFLDLWRVLNRIARVPLKNVKHGFHAYENAITRDDAFATKVEYAVKASSYLLSSMVKASTALSELIYCASKLLEMVHDYLYRKKYGIHVTELWTAKSNLEGLLTVLLYAEAFIEIGRMGI